MVGYKLGHGITVCTLSLLLPLGGTLQTYFENLSLRGETARGLSFGGGAPTDFIPFTPVDPWTTNSRESLPEKELRHQLNK
ncbi:hypothetical protein V5799_005627 [Amblyomma americanum]|uniref:Secreted protein n=1 Tax=Amblyomma americanum TaxID=6943 RepID=A0AAQ4DYR4_AMBAM